MRRQAGYIFAIRIIRLAFAILNLSFSAKYFGVGLQRDIWLLALSAVVVFEVAIWAPINDTFRAKFLFVKADKGEAEALQQTKSLLLLINLITILLVALIMIFPDLISRLLAPGYKDEQRKLLNFMIRLLAPTFLLTQVTKILTSILNTYNSFIMPEVSGLITQVFTLVVIITLAPSIGIVSLAFSYYSGLILLLVLLILQLRKHKVNLFQKLLSAKLRAALPFFMFSLPFYLPHFTAQLNLIVERSLATSTAPGTVSILDYSRKFTDIPMDVLTGILVSLLVPVLTSKFSAGLKQQFFEEFSKIYQFGFLTVALIVGMFTGCADEIVIFLYKNGTISTEALRQIGKLTMFYSWAAFGVFLYLIFGLSLLSSKRGKLFALYGTLAQLFMIGINLYFFPEFGLIIFPFSLGISHLIAAFVMSFYFPYRTPSLLITTIKYSLLVGTVGFLMYMVNKYLMTFEPPILIILFNVFFLNLILVVVIFITRMEERYIIQRFLKKLFP